MSSELAIDQQDIKNMEAAQEYDDNLDMVRKVAEDKWLNYWKAFHTDLAAYDEDYNQHLWNEYKKADEACRNRDNQKAEAKKYGFDLDLSQAELDNCKKIAKEVVESEAGKKYVASVTAMFNGLSREMGIDPNDYQEDDKVPADPQEREMNESSNY